MKTRRKNNNLEIIAKAIDYAITFKGSQNSIDFTQQLLAQLKHKTGNNWTKEDAVGILRNMERLLRNNKNPFVTIGRDKEDYPISLGMDEITHLVNGNRARRTISGRTASNEYVSKPIKKDLTEILRKRQQQKKIRSRSHSRSRRL